MKNRKNFSLIELLIVIAVIAVLISIAFPVYTGIQERAKKTKAKAEMNAIETAVKNYEMTYGILPLPDGTATSGIISGGTQYPDLMTFLTDVGAPGKSADVTGNARGIRFLDVPNNYTSAGFQDPWGNDFTIYVDTDYDGVVYGPNVNSESAKTNLYGTIFICTHVGDDDSDTVYSWN